MARTKEKTEQNSQIQDDKKTQKEEKNAVFHSRPQMHVFCSITMANWFGVVIFVLLA